MSRLVGSASALDGGVGLMTNLPDDDRHDLYSLAFNFSWHGRHPQAIAARSPYFELWGGPQQNGPDYPIVAGVWFEPQRLNDGGYWRPYFLRGSVVDATDVPQTGVNVTAFRTSDDVVAAEGWTDGAGNYGVPTNFIGVAHYLVAYLPGATDQSGTTVNTLIPAL
jgi:hypothetical protein